MQCRERHKGTTMKTACVVGLMLACSTPALAHDFTAEIARFNEIAATRAPGSEQSVAARIAMERAQAELEQAETRLLLRVRSLTNSALRDVGEQPAFLTSEIQRLERALAAPRAADTAALARARQLLDEIRVVKAAYDALDRSSSEHMRNALRLIESAPAR